MAASLQLSDLQKGASVWVDEEGYPVPGIVEGSVFGGKGVAIRPLNIDMLNQNMDNKIIQDARKIKIRISDPSDHEDLIKLDELTEAGILWNLRNRYMQDKFTTYVGNIFVHINPYKTTSVYDQDMVKIYKNSNLGTRPAHIYALGEAMYSTLVETKQNQVLVLSGESGSGKTEAGKMVMKYLIDSVPNQIRSSKDSSLMSHLILDTGTILEAFGNAKTLLNDNSSRFAKYTEILLRQGRIFGAKFHEFSLERTRLVCQSDGERNFHIFYQMIKGLSPELKTKFGLSSPEKYFYINQGKCSSMSGTMDKANFEKVQQAFDLIGMCSDQIHSIYRILSALLHLGNLYFDSTGDGVSIGNKAEVQWVAYLLQLDIDQLCKALTTRQTDVKGEMVSTSLGIESALDIRDTVSKTVYSQMFTWLVGRVNKVTDSPIAESSIALLDMFGFQSLPTNSLEQLCVNYANEKMQQFFVKSVFKLEQQEYALENLAWEEKYGMELDNNRIVDLINKRPHGIFHLLDDESSFPKASDDSFLRKCHFNHVDKSYYSKPKMNDLQFCIRHYAGWQWYQVDGFLEKNRSVMKNSLVNLLRDTQNATLRQIMENLFDSKLSEKKSNTKNSQNGTVVSSFNDSISQMMKKLQNCKPYFVRCINPNHEKIANKFDLKIVHNQLKHLGLADTLKIRKLGFPYRYTFREFVIKYGNLIPSSALEDKLDKEIVYLVLSSQGIAYSEEYQIGSNKVFIKQNLNEQLEDQREKVVYKAALQIQKNVKGYLGRVKYAEKRKAALKIQSAERGRQARNKYSKMKSELYDGVAMEARRSKRLQVYEELQQKRLEPQRDDEEKTKARILASVESLDAPKDLAPVIVNLTGNVSDYIEKCVSRVSASVPVPAVQHMIPKDLNEFSFAEYIKTNMRGHTMGMRREPITVPFLPKEDDAQFQQALAIFKLILRFMNGSSMSYAQEILLADYIIQQGIKHESMRDEIYAQLANQTINNPNSANRARGWWLLALAASSFLPSKEMFKYFLNYVHNAEDSEGYGSIVCAKLLQAVHQSSEYGRTRRHPPSLLEHGAVRNKGRMVIHAMHADASPVTCPVESWCTASDLAERALRERGITRSFGWTVGIDCVNLDELYISGTEYFMDCVSHLELPEKFPATRSDTIANYRPCESRGMLIKKALAQKVQVTETDGFNSDESVPSEPRPAGAHRGQQRRQRPVQDLSVPEPPTQTHNQSQSKPEKLFGVEDNEPCYDEVPIPPHQNNHQSRPNVTNNEPGLQVYPAAASYGLQDRPFLQQGVHPARPLPDYGSSQYGRYMPCRTVLSTIPSMTEIQSQYQDNGMSYHPTNSNDGSTLRGSVTLGGGSTMGEYHSASMIRARPDSPEAIYGRNGQPMSHFSTGEPIYVADRSTVSGAGWAHLPSDYSTRSIASHVRKVKIPSKNSDVDKFLDDLFDPVLQESTEGVYDSRSIAASIKGGGENQFQEQQNHQQQQAAGYSPAFNPQMVMMMPMDARMFGMPSPMQMPAGQNAMFGMPSPAMQQMQGVQSGMQFMPMPIQLMPMQMPWNGAAGFQQPQLAGEEFRFSEQRNMMFDTSKGTQGRSPDQVPSPPTLPPEPSYPPPPPPPHMPKLTEYEEPRTPSKPVSSNGFVTVLETTQINFREDRPEFTHSKDRPLIISGLRPSTESARMQENAQRDETIVSHNIRDIMNRANIQDTNSHDNQYQQAYHPNRRNYPEQVREREEPTGVVYSQIERHPPPPPRPHADAYNNNQSMPSPTQIEIIRQQEALRMMKENSKDLPPPIDQIHMWRGSGNPVYGQAQQPQPPAARPQFIQEDYRLQDSRPISHMSSHPRLPSPPPSNRLPESESVTRLPQVEPITRLPEVEAEVPGDWVNEEEVVREAPVKVQRRIKYEPEGYYRTSYVGKPDSEGENEVRLPSPSLEEQSKERQQKKPILGYNDVPYEFVVRKELFFPNEQLNESVELDLVFSQVLRDCTKPAHLRIRSYEKEQLLAMLHSYGVRTDSVRAHQVPAMLKRSVVEIARQWPLYFCRLFTVVEDRSSEYVSQFLGVSETGVRLIIRNFDAPKDPLKILDHFNFDDLDRVDVDTEQLCLVTRRGLQVRVYTDKAELIKQLIQDYLYGPNQDKQYVRAVSDYVTKEPNLLCFRAGDIIELVSNDATQQPPKLDDLQSRPRWMYGKLNGRFGNFPSGYVQPLDPQTMSPTYSNNSQDLTLNSPSVTGGMDETHSTIMTEDPWSDWNGSGVGGRNGASKGKLTMMEFAVMFFRHGPGKHMIVRGEDGTVRGTLKPQDKKSKKEKEWTYKELADQVKFSKLPVQSSLLRLETNEYNKKAIECFNAIMRYMGDAAVRKGQTLADCVYEILMNCHQHPPLRDEVYCQIMKQTTSNKSGRPDSAIKGWRLFTLLTSYFNCSEVLKPYLYKYLSDAAGDTRRAYHGTAQVCLQNLKKTFKFGGRKYLLGGKEIEAVTLGKNLKRQIYQLPGGHQKVVNTKSVTVVEEIIQELCQELNIRSPLEQQEFCLCYILESENVMKLLSNDEYILDVTTELEHKDKQFFLLLKRTVWIHPLRLDNDCYIDVMFFQLVPDYLEGLLVTMKTPDSISASLMDDIAKLAALLHRADQEWNSQPVHSQTVLQLLPRIVQNVRHVTPEQWTQRVNEKMNKLPSKLSHSEARARFLDILQSWQLFGSTFFYITNVDDTRVHGECLLAINKHGVQFLHIITHETLLEYRLSEILSTHKANNTPPMGAPAQHFLDIKVGNLIQQKVVTLQTDQGTEISRLLGQYIFVDSQNRGFINTEPPTI